MTTNKSVGRSNAPQETATECSYAGLQAIMSTVGLFANKYIALIHEWNITGNYAARMHKTLKHQCVHYIRKLARGKREKKGWGPLTSVGQCYVIGLLRFNGQWTGNEIVFFFVQLHWSQHCFCTWWTWLAEVVLTFPQQKEINLPKKKESKSKFCAHCKAILIISSILPTFCGLFQICELFFHISGLLNRKINSVFSVTSRFVAKERLVFVQKWPKCCPSTAVIPLNDNCRLLHWVYSELFSVLDGSFWNERKKLSQFGHNAQKASLVNNVTASFNTTMGQITEMPQWKKKILEKSLICPHHEKNAFLKLVAIMQQQGHLLQLLLNCLFLLLLLIAER